VARPDFEQRQPKLLSILKQGDFLIASIHTALHDDELEKFQNDLVDQIGTSRSRGIIIDVAALDVLDSFASRTLRNLARMARLRGAETVIVGIQPDVAFSIVQLGMELDVHTALDLEEGLVMLDALTSGSRSGSLSIDILRDF
jgi:rsbT antagonist protein RsbS